MRSLAERGVHYFKADFTAITQATALRVRHNPRIVAGGGTEAIRTGFSIFHEELRAVDPEALVLNSSGPDLPGKGASALLYACNDTDNTGMLSWAHMRNNYGLNLAGHLFKHKRWGIIQPSCLCTGLPGTLEEARTRATATFMSGGQVDISDDLTMLPEDRWQVLLATLPPLGDAARPVDLFDPIGVTMVPYRAWFGEEADHLDAPGPEVSRVWHLPVATDWDEWDLVALFNYDPPPPTDSGEFITRFELPLERVGLNPEKTYWAYEFWAGHFLGEVPAVWENPHGYQHPGDAKTLIASRQPGILDVAFFGPGVKLLAFRKKRPHPWPVGTSFHQSGGAELSEVAWDDTGVLRGVLNRPRNQHGVIVIAGSPHRPRSASVGGQPAAPRAGACGSLILPITTSDDTTQWEVSWQ
jgi:hypothetical protein